MFFFNRVSTPNLRSTINPELAPPKFVDWRTVPTVRVVRVKCDCQGPSFFVSVLDEPVENLPRGEHHRPEVGPLLVLGNGVRSPVVHENVFEGFRERFGEVLALPFFFECSLGEPVVVHFARVEVDFGAPRVQNSELELQHKEDVRRQSQQALAVCQVVLKIPS